MGGSRRIIVAVVAAGIAAVVVGGFFGGRREPPAVSAPGAARSVAPPRAMLGAGSCSSSGCHAAAVEGHAAWQSAYTVWASRDRHAQAYQVLHEPLARQIVAALAARNPDRPHPPAHENDACLGCHATQRKTALTDGVSCESCHGPAGDWLVAHTLPGWKTKGNTLGMVDLADPFACAQQCSQCHVGGPATPDGALREVSHDLIAAGHPRLTFELRDFKQAEPPHWRDRFTGDGEEGPLSEWALGRLGGLDAFLTQVASQAATAARKSDGHQESSDTAGVWPEFTAFECYGCHRPAIASFDRDPAGTEAAGRIRVSPRVDPMIWSLLDVILPEAAAHSIDTARDDMEAEWWLPPSQSTLENCRREITQARPFVGGRLAALSPATLARQVIASVDLQSWDEAVSATRALTAIVDQLAATRDVTDARQRLASIRLLLEFRETTVGGRQVRFDSPQGYDPAQVRSALEAVIPMLNVSGKSHP
ncbi:MAG: multiheme c-type cytochrome [Planctomycetia bacterium]